MLPENAVIFLMQANGVLHDGGLAVVVGHRHVEIVNLSQAIAAELKRVGELAQAVFAGVERALPEMVCRRVGIRNDHVGDAGPIDDRSFAGAVAKRDLMQHEALACRPSDAERPVLPANLPPLYREARAVLLHDIERFDVVADFRDRGAVVVAGFLGDRNDIRLVDQVNHPVLDQIDERDHAFNRMRIAVVLAVRAPVRNRADQPAALFDLAVEIARGERVHLDQFDVVVVQPAPGHRAPPSRIGLDDVADLEDLLDRNRRLTVGMDLCRVLAPFGNLPRSQIDGRDMRGSSPAIEHRYGRAPRWPRIRLPSQDIGLGRFFELNVGEAGIRAKLLARPQQVRRQRHLGLA